MQTISNNLRVQRDTARVVIVSKRSGRANWMLEIILFLFSLAFTFGTLPNLIRAQNLLSIGNILAILVLLAGILFAYRFITLLVDSDTVELTPEKIKVRAGPLPAWDGGCAPIAREKLTSVEAKTRISNPRQAGRSGVTATFDVLATLTDGSTKTILGGSKNSEPIHFIANEIRSFYQLS